MTRRRDGAHRALTPAELLELRLGCAADRTSLFASAADRREAVAALANLDAERSGMDALIEAGPILAELRRRHDPHFDYTDDPKYPATFDAVGCPRCNRAGWVPPWHHGAADAQPVLS